MEKLEGMARRERELCDKSMQEVLYGETNFKLQTYDG